MILRIGEFMNDAELILTPAGEIYHLLLKPGDIAPNIITVGDPERVKMIEKYFDEVNLRKQNREFFTITGRIGDSKLSVISTGIGSDNIDIVINEVDALFNIDFENKRPKSQLETVNFFRLGTSGSLQADILPGELVISQMAIGIDNLMHFYKSGIDQAHPELHKAIRTITSLDAYIANGSEELIQKFDHIKKRGITFTSNGFYGPQGRQLRAGVSLPDYLEDLAKVEYRGLRITNFEMETAAIYTLSEILGHRAISINAILANRVHGTFANNPRQVVEDMIESCIEVISG